jgi:hypothetical protein
MGDVCVAARTGTDIVLQEAMVGFAQLWHNK